jgi:hypothetical protein
VGAEKFFACGIFIFLFINGLVLTQVAMKQYWFFLVIILGCEHIIRFRAYEQDLYAEHEQTEDSESQLDISE